MHEAAARHPAAARVELWFEDEARIGQKGRVTHVWYQKGVRPRGVREQRYASVQLFGAVCPERGTGVALVPLSEMTESQQSAFRRWVDSAPVRDAIGTVRIEAGQRMDEVEDDLDGRG